MNSEKRCFWGSSLLRGSVFACVISASLFSTACSEGKFSQSVPDSKASQRSIDASGETTGKFVQPGKSLDLYVIMDRSGSLFVDPSTRATGSGSDPDCKRFDAFLQLVEGLRGVLKNKEQVRMTVVTFNNYATTLPVSDSLLTMSNSEIESLYKRGVCFEPKGLLGTEYALGINRALSEYHKLNLIKKLDLQTVLFFSDGAARDESPEQLKNAISSLNQTFSQRIYGVLLGATTDKCTLETTEGEQMSTTECMMEVAGGASERVIQVETADALAAAITGLIKK